MGKILKSTASVVAGLALAFTSTIASGLPASAAEGCNVTFDTYKTIQKGSTGDQAKAVECLLDQAGFTATVDGKITAAEAQQIAKFRKSVGLDVVTAVGRRGWSALIAQGDTPTLKAGDTGADVSRLQLAVRAGGFTKMPTTGTLDAASVAALKSAQKERNLTQSGTADAKTWKLLQSGKLVIKNTAKKAKPKKSGSSSKGTRALAFAKKQLGEKYRYGAAGPNRWDCSGLTQKAWKSVGVSLPHNTRAQWKKGKKVSKSDLKKGDLVFFYSGISHVAVYAGNGKVIHAPRPGKKVSYIKMKYMPYKGARRPG
ncbi:MAG TPA: NlpC/P60 family protein [Propionibacteriaceae bacterium]